MTLLAAASHEVGDLSEYDTTIEDVGDLSVTAPAALAGTGFGLSVLIDDATAIYGEQTISAPASNIIRARFYIDPNALTMASGDEFIVFDVRAGGGPSTTPVFVELGNTSGYWLKAFLGNDAAGFPGTALVTIADAPHLVEVVLTRASTLTASDGRVDLWIDGVLEQSITGEDNFDAFAAIDAVRLGAMFGIDAGTSGTFYLDELAVHDDIRPVTDDITLRQNLRLFSKERFDATQVPSGEAVTDRMIRHNGFFRDKMYHSGTVPKPVRVVARSLTMAGARQYTEANIEKHTIVDNASLSVPSTDFALSAWVYIDSLGSRSIIGHWGTSQQSWLLWAQGGFNRFQFLASLDGTAEDESADSSVTLIADRWYFVVAWYDDTAKKMFIQVDDGTVDEVGYTDGFHDSTAEFQIGGNAKDTAYMDGRIARAGLWKGVPTAAQRTALYNAGVSLMYSELSADLKTDLVSYWNLDEASGDAIDAHGSNDLTDEATVTAAAGPPSKIDLLQAPLSGERFADLSELRIVAATFQSRTTNAAQATIGPEATNGYPIFGTGNSRDIEIGETAIVSTDAANRETVQPGRRIIEISGTAGDIVDAKLYFGE